MLTYFKPHSQKNEHELTKTEEVEAKENRVS